MIVAFRADASFEMGIGHVMRCLSLARGLEKKGAICHFICKEHLNNLIDEIRLQGFLIHALPIQEPSEDIDDNQRLTHAHWLGSSWEFDALRTQEYLALLKPDLLIVDHYSLDYRWENRLSTHCNDIMVIDDLADRQHDCRYLLDQTYNCSIDRYKELVPDRCELMLGTKYALLRSEFQINRENVEKVRDQQSTDKILIMFGGTDPDNLTMKVLRTIFRRDNLPEINVIVTSSVCYLKELELFCENNANIGLHISPSNIADLMLSSTIAIGAAGTTSWERCAVGLPAIVVIQADNQRKIAKELALVGVISPIEIDDIETSLNESVDAWLDEGLSKTSTLQKCLDICDGLGVERVAEKVFQYV